MSSLLVPLVLAAAAVATWLLLRERRRRAAVEAELVALTGRFAGVVDADRERERVLREASSEAERISAAARVEESRCEALRTESQALEERLRSLSADLAALDEQANLQSFGFYKPHYEYDTSEQYKREEDRIRVLQAAMVKGGSAAVCDTEWQVGGSRAEGRKMTNQTLRLMLRAFNGESDAAVSRVRYNNIHVMEARIRKAFEAINKAGSVQTCRITPEFLDAKLQELRITHEYQEKLQEEKEEQRRIREQMREEEIARREMEKAKLDAEKEEQRYSLALARARQEVEGAAGAKQEKLMLQIAELEARLAEAHERKERAIARAQMTRSGHVYVISNVGSFGEHVYKIGMTRRLDPMDRIRELGDASVPFQFDVHAIIYAEDAPGLENTLHRMFGERRLNRVNERKEFFHVSIEEVAEAVRANHGEIEFTLAAEAAEFRKTLALLASGERSQEDHFALPAHWTLVGESLQPRDSPTAV